MMRRLLLLIALLFPGIVWGQGIPFTVNPPAPNATMNVCSAPAVGSNPCTNTVTVYSNVTLTTTISQPIQIGPTGNYTFFFNASSAPIVVQISGRADQIAGGGGSSPGGTGSVLGGIGGGTAQVQTMTPSPAITSYVTNGSVWYCWLPVAANTAAAPTLNISGLGAKPITKIGAGGVVALIANDLQTTAVACAVYDGTEFQLQNPQAGIAVTTSIGIGASPPTACGTQTACEAFTEASCSGATPTVGQDYRCYDSSAHGPVCSNNGSAQSVAACGSGSALSGITAATASNTIANGNNPQIWNWAQTTDAQAGLTCGETSAATGGTLAANGSANQAVCKSSTASNSTATPFSMEQGAITNTVATPSGQVRFTWNNASLVGRGFGIYATNTASASTSTPFFINVGNSMPFGVTVGGVVDSLGTPAMTSDPPGAGSGSGNPGWKQCYDLLFSTCMGVDSTERELYFRVSSGQGGWFGLGPGNPNGNDAGGTPDTASSVAFPNNNGGLGGGTWMKEGTCITYAPGSGAAMSCADSVTHEELYSGNGSAFGMLVRRQPSPTLQKSETGTADANVLTLTPFSVASTYRVCVSISVSSATSGVIGWTLSWTDSNGNAQTNIAQSLFQLGTAAPALTFTTSAAGNYSSACPQIDLNNAGANIIVKWVGGGTTVAKMSANIERLQ